MKLKDWIILLALIAAFGMGAFVSRKVERPLQTAALPGDSPISWKTSLQKSLEAGKAAHRPILVDFYASWCSYCREMDQTTYQNPRVVELSRRFVCAHIDVDKNEDLAKSFRVDGLPTLVFLNWTGKEKKRVEGYVPPPDLIADLQSLL